MFGYIRPVESELLVKDLGTYRAAYCGMCKYGGRHTSRLTRFFLNYDFVLLALLRLALTGEKAESKKGFCPYYPKRSEMLYAPKAYAHTLMCFSVLAYYKNEDDINDSRGIKKISPLLKRPLLRSMMRRSGKDEAFASETKLQLERLASLEKEGCADIDEVAECFAQILAHAASAGLEGERCEIARRCGYHIGRYIYIIDAIDDLEADEKNKNYNPILISRGGLNEAKAAVGEYAQTAYDSMMAFSATLGLSEGSDYDRLIYNITELGGAAALKRVQNK